MTPASTPVPPAAGDAGDAAARSYEELIADRLITGAEGYGHSLVSLREGANAIRHLLKALAAERAAREAAEREVARLKTEADGEFVQAAAEAMRAYESFDPRDYWHEGITADDFRMLFEEDMREAWRLTVEATAARAILEASLAAETAAREAAERDRDEARGWAEGWHRTVKTILTIAGLSPALGADEAVKEVRSAFEERDARIHRLLIAFHDATRRPLGVTPDSGLEFYDARLAEEAEERRPQHGSPQERAERPEVSRAAAEAEAARMRADALRYRFLRDHHGYAYGQDHVEPSPAECWITWCWQQTKPGETADFDALIDADIARLDEDGRTALTGADHADT